MTDEKFSTGLRHCDTCADKTQHNNYSSRLKAADEWLDAYLEYAVCQRCGKMNPLTAAVRFDADSTPEAGVFNHVSIPATSDAWHTQHGDDMWFKLFHPHKRELTSKEVESLYGLKSGAARQASKRGYIKARKLGSLLLFDAQEARAYWGRD